MRCWWELFVRGSEKCLRCRGFRVVRKELQYSVVGCWLETEKVPADCSEKRPDCRMVEDAGARRPPLFRGIFASTLGAGTGCVHTARGEMFALCYDRRHAWVRRSRKLLCCSDIVRREFCIAKRLRCLLGNVLECARKRMHSARKKHGITSFVPHLGYFAPCSLGSQICRRPPVLANVYAVP